MRQLCSILAALCVFGIVRAEETGQAKPVLKTIDVLSPDKHFRVVSDGVPGPGDDRGLNIVSAKGEVVSELGGKFHAGAKEDGILWSPDSQWLAVRFGTETFALTHVFHLESGSFKEIPQLQADEPAANADMTPIAWLKGDRLKIHFSGSGAGQPTFRADGEFIVKISADEPPQLIRKNIFYDYSSSREGGYPEADSRSIYPLPQIEVPSPDKRYRVSYDATNNSSGEQSWKVLSAAGDIVFQQLETAHFETTLYTGADRFFLWSPDSKWLAVTLGFSKRYSTHLFHLEGRVFKEAPEPDPDEAGTDNVNMFPVAWLKGNRLKLHVSWPHAGHAGYFDEGEFTVEVSGDKPSKLVSKNILHTEYGDETHEESTGRIIFPPPETKKEKKEAGAIGGAEDAGRTKE